MTETTLETSPKSFSLRRVWLRKISLLILVFLGSFALLQWWQHHASQGQHLFAEQSAELMRETLKALAQTAAYLIENDQLEGLQALTVQMASNPYLHDVVVYDANGVRLSASKSSQPARLLYVPQHPEQLLPMVQEISQNGHLMGYIKISLKQGSGYSAVSQHWQWLMQQVLWMICCTALLTLIFTRALPRIRRRKSDRVNSTKHSSTKD